MKTSGLYRLIDGTTQQRLRAKMTQAAVVKKILDQLPEAKRLVRTEKPVFTSTMNPHFGVPTFSEDDSISITPSQGTTVGRYKVLCDISKELDGTLWLCKETKTEGPVMVMRIFDTTGQADHERWRFEGESQVLAKLRHPNCVIHRESGRVDKDMSYRVTDFGRGVPVTEFCDAEQLSITDRVSVIKQLCEIAADLHEAGFAGLDLYPGNVLAQCDGDDIVLQLVDLRVAVAKLDSTEASRLAIDEDIHRIGLMLLQQLTGLSWKACVKEAAAVDNLAASEILRKQCFAMPKVAKYRSLEPASVSEAISKALDAVVTKALTSNRSVSFSSAAKFAEELQSLSLSNSQR